MSHPDPQFDPMDRELTGVYFDVPAGVYRSIQALSFSGTNDLEVSGAHYQFGMKNPKEQTREMELGEEIHAGLLEEERFAREYTGIPKELVGMNKNRNDWKAFVAECEAKGKRVLKDETLDIINAVRANEDWKRLMSGSKTEVSIFWEDPLSKARCKGRVDILTNELVLADPKTTSKPIDEGSFAKHIFNRKYYRQAAMYADGLGTLLGKRLDKFVHVAISTKPPYSPETSVAFYETPGSALDLGRAELAPLMRKYAEYSATGVWPGLPRGIRPIDLPTWAYSYSDDECDFMGNKRG